MPRPTFPRSQEQHARQATKVLTKHVAASGIPIVFPVPIELIVEQTYGLSVLNEDLEDSDDAIVLGALSPSTRTIILNAARQGLFDEVMGPERFTLAHELAHWIYDTVIPEQLTMPLGEPQEDLYCYHHGSPGLSDTLQIRETNANKLAAHILMPENLVREAHGKGGLVNLRATAVKWQVSVRSLEIRTQELGLNYP